MTSSPQFVYVSAAEGALVADNAIGGAGRTTDYQTMADRSQNCTCSDIHGSRQT